MGAMTGIASGRFYNLWMRFAADLLQVEQLLISDAGYGCN
jgi:hypothetical protein